MQLYKLSQCITGISWLPIRAPYHCNSYMHHTHKLPKETWLDQWTLLEDWLYSTCVNPTAFAIFVDKSPPTYAPLSNAMTQRQYIHTLQASVYVGKRPKRSRLLQSTDREVHFGASGQDHNVASQKLLLPAQLCMAWEREKYLGNPFYSTL